MSDDIASKIRKLLAIANDASASEAERETALATAGRLAQRHAIDMASVGAEARDWGTSVVATYRATWPRNPKAPEFAGFIAYLLEMFFFVKVFGATSFETSENGLTTKCDVTLFGAACDRKVAQYVYVYLRREFLRLKGLREKHLFRNLRANELRNFYHGVCLGIRFTLAHDRRQTSVSCTVATDETALTAIRSHLEDAFEKNYPNCVKAKGQHSDVDVEGYSAGRSVQVRTPLASAVDAPLRLGVSP